MRFKINKKKRDLIISFALATALIPILITAFELITTDKESVVFLEGYPTPIIVFFLIYYVLIIVLVLSWFLKQVISYFRIKHEMEKTELLHLKSQVNPHFFFNTLNNLYGLVGTDAKKAQELILKLSDMMRYGIYEGEKEVVTLKTEVEYLKNYITLHQMRYRKEIDVKFEVEIENDYEVMPLLFIILLENAFKHGVENLGKGAYAYFKLIAKDNKVSFETENNFDQTIPKENNGIGLKNLKRRLELVYPKKHSLSFSTKGNVYKAQLTLQL